LNSPEGFSSIVSRRLRNALLIPKKCSELFNCSGGGEVTRPERTDLSPVVLLEAGFRAGITGVSAHGLAELAGVGLPTAWRWLRGVPVSSATDSRIRQALGLRGTATPKMAVRGHRAVRPAGRR
jgi:hypothetical protein